VTGERDLDPLEAATERTRAAEERFIETPLTSPDLVSRAEIVEQRAEEVHELAEDERARLGSPPAPGTA
jgi:hypothetical protein